MGDPEQLEHTLAGNIRCGKMAENAKILPFQTDNDLNGNMFLSDLISASTYN